MCVCVCVCVCLEILINIGRRIVKRCLLLFFSFLKHRSTIFSKALSLTLSPPSLSLTHTLNHIRIKEYTHSHRYTHRGTRRKEAHTQRNAHAGKHIHRSTHTHTHTLKHIHKQRRPRVHRKLSAHPHARTHTYTPHAHTTYTDWYIWAVMTKHFTDNLLSYFVAAYFKLINSYLFILFFFFVFTTFIYKLSDSGSQKGKLWKEIKKKRKRKRNGEKRLPFATHQMCRE